MATQRTLKDYCWTCGGDQQHRQLNKKEEDWLKERLGRNGVGEFWLCVNVLDAGTGKQCRNLRTGFNKKPFAEPIKAPVLD